MMNLLVLLRFLLGQWSRTSALIGRLPVIVKVASQPYSTNRAVRDGFIPHEWISMVYVLTEGSPPARFTLRGAFERPAHPLDSILRFARRLAGVPKPYPALAATVCPANRRSGAIDARRCALD
jgi:hypothetical protein